MARYKLKIGRHVQGGKEYVAGNVIESKIDLVKLFVGKFERVVETDDEDDFPTAVTIAPAPAPVAAGPSPEPEPEPAPPQEEPIPAPTVRRRRVRR